MEVRVLGQNDKIYVAPALIYHYVKEHHYQPPEEFILAVEALWEKKVYLFTGTALTIVSPGVACRFGVNHTPRWPRSAGMNVRCLMGLTVALLSGGDFFCIPISLILIFRICIFLFWFCWHIAEHRVYQRRVW